MTFKYKSEIIILVPTAIFLLLFSGLYLYYEFYLSSYFGQNPYEWFAFADSKKPPSTFDILFSGFKDILNLFSCLSLSYVSVLFIKPVRNKLAIKAGLWNALARSAILTLTLGLLYFIYIFIRFIFINGYTLNFALNEITSQICLFAVMYLCVIIPFVNSYNKRDFTKNWKPGVQHCVRYSDAYSMTKRIKTAFVILSINLGGLTSCIFSALAPPKLTIIKDYISTDRDFINGVTIEKVRVDSIGNQGYPVKYTTVYTTHCGIHHPTNRPPEPPNKIKFNKPGKYSWDEDTIKVRYIHSGLAKESSDSTKKLWWLDKFGDYPVCPIKFENEQWYFITIGDPQVTGVFFYIDNLNKGHQYFLASGVSPI